MSTVLAVDGGNSKTDVALVRDDGAVLGYVRGPQTSPDHLGIPPSLDALQALVDEAGGAADVAVLLLAGIDFPDTKDAYRAQAEARGWGARTIVGNDTFAVLRAGTERGWGVAVTCGAGINCLGIAPDGREVRFPSLGAISGDWGGGFDVGLAAVSAAARSEDGRGPHTSLGRLVPAHFGLETPVELARALAGGTIDREELGGLPPVVFSAAEVDWVAGEIVDRLAEEVATMARVALTRLDVIGASVDVVLGGGLLRSENKRLLAGVEARLRDVGPGISILVAPSPPVVGSALVGLDELGAPTEAKARVRAELGDAVAGLETAAP